MNWEECRYNDIAEKFSDDDVAKLIDAMILNFDKCGKYYEMHHIVELINDCVSNSSEILSLVQEKAQRDIKDLKRGKSRPLIFEDDFEDLNIMLRKEDILNSIMAFIEKDAMNKCKDRYFLRLQEGDSVDFESCDSYNPLKDVVEFYKDGGWGIADTNGKVLVKNHINVKPSSLPFLFKLNGCPYRMIRDRDTGLYGVLSLKSFNESIHCLYDCIEAVEYWIEHRKHFILKVKKNGKWGCYNEKCSLVIECHYDDIRIVSDLIECGRDGDYIYSEKSNLESGKIYEGTKYLYDLYGRLLLGGYNYFDYQEYKYNKRYIFYFSTEYEKYFVKYNVDDDDIEIPEYRTNYANLISCLVLDNHFETLLKSKGKCIRVPYGKIFQSIQELQNYIPSDILLSGMIDLSDLDDYSLIYLKKKNGDNYLVSDYYPAIPDCIIEGGIPERWDDFLIEDDEVIIAKIENGMITRRFRVNEIAKTDSGLLLFRNGERVGFYSQYGVTPAMYSAVTIEFNDNKIYVAQIIPEILESDIKKWNPNIVQHKGYTIQYFELLSDGILVKLQDDWKIFCPKDHKWFPSDFKSKNGLVDEVYDDYDNCDSGKSYEKYGGYNGYDDDTIDDAFDGYPEATWNVD